jgi:hypothetical protein
MTGQAAEKGRAEQDASQDLTDDDWLAASPGCEAGKPRYDEHQRDLANDVSDRGIHAFFYSAIDGLTRTD